MQVAGCADRSVLRDVALVRPSASSALCRGAGCHPPRERCPTDAELHRVAFLVTRNNRGCVSFRGASAAPSSFPAHAGPLARIVPVTLSTLPSWPKFRTSTERKGRPHHRRGPDRERALGHSRSSDVSSCGRCRHTERETQPLARTPRSTTLDDRVSPTGLALNGPRPVTPRATAKPARSTRRPTCRESRLPNRKRPE
jgi:hypothetical protein